MTALGHPADLLDDPPSEDVHRFLTRDSDAAAPSIPEAPDLSSESTP